MNFKHFYDAGLQGSGTYKFRHYSQTEPSSGETWVLNQSLSATLAQTRVDFTSNNENFIYITRSGGPLGSLTYGKADFSVVYANTEDNWTDEAYRTITFDEPVTDTTLLTWLQANGTKQGEVTEHTLTFTGVTVTIDGTPVTSPYTLNKNCTIVATANTANYEVVVTAGSIEHHTDVDGDTLTLADTDINIVEASVGGTKMNNITINYTTGGGGSN